MVGDGCGEKNPFFRLVQERNRRELYVPIDADVDGVLEDLQQIEFFKSRYRDMPSSHSEDDEPVSINVQGSLFLLRRVLILAHDWIHAKMLTSEVPF